MNYSSDDPDCWWTNTKCNSPKMEGIPADVSIMNEPRTLGYGFDDGPNCSHNAFYDYLKSQNQKASKCLRSTRIEMLLIDSDDYSNVLHREQHHELAA